MEEGGDCGQDPYWNFRAGFQYDGGVCRLLRMFAESPDVEQAKNALEIQVIWGV